MKLDETVIKCFEELIKKADEIESLIEQYKRPGVDRSHKASILDVAENIFPSKTQIPLRENFKCYF